MEKRSTYPDIHHAMIMVFELSSERVRLLSDGRELKVTYLPSCLKREPVSGARRKEAHRAAFPQTED